MVSISTITLHCHTCHLGVVIKENVIYFYRLHVTNCFLFSVYQSHCLINFSVYDINNICYSSQGAKDGRLFNEQNFLQRAAKPASGKGFNVSTITSAMTVTCFSYQRNLMCYRIGTANIHVILYKRSAILYLWYRFIFLSYVAIIYIGTPPDLADKHPELCHPAQCNPNRGFFLTICCL